MFASALVFLGLYPLLARLLPESRAVAETSRLQILDAVIGPEARSFWLLALLSLSSAAFSAVAAGLIFERLIGQLGLSATTAVAVSLGGGTLGGIGFFAGGRASDTIGRRPTAIAAIVASGCGGLLLYWTEAIPLLVIGSFLAGLGAFAVIPALGSQRAELFAASHRASTTTLLNAVGVVGAAGGLLLSSRLIAEVGLSRAVSGLAIGLVVAILAEILLPESRDRILT